MKQTLTVESLSDRIGEFMTKMAQGAPPEVVQTLGAELKKMAEAGIAGRALQAGTSAPSFTLPDAEGKPFDLAGQLAKGPVVLTFYRGGWCPFCDLQLRAYQEILPAIHRLGAELIAVSPQTPDYTASTVEAKALTFRVLSDKQNSVARQYGLVFRLSDSLKALQKTFGNPLPKFNGDESWELPMPGTFVLDAGGVIRLASVDSNFTSRLEPALLLEALQKLRA